MNNETKKLGFWSIVLLTINSIIGSGIFLSPGSVVKMSGKYAPFIYLAAAAFATFCVDYNCTFNFCHRVSYY